MLLKGSGRCLGWNVSERYISLEVEVWVCVIIAWCRKVIHKVHFLVNGFAERGLQCKAALYCC